MAHLAKSKTDDMWCLFIAHPLNRFSHEVCHKYRNVNVDYGYGGEAKYIFRPDKAHPK